MVGTAAPSVIMFGAACSLLVMVLLYSAILYSGAQSVTADRDARRSDGLNKYKGV